MSRKKTILSGIFILLLSAGTIFIWFKMTNSTSLSAVNFSGEKDLIIRNFNRINPPGQADLDKAKKVLSDLNPDGSFKSINYSDRTYGMWDGIKHWANLHVLVAAWHAEHDAEYLSAIISGLEYWSDKMPVNPNWWWQFVGVPLNAIKVLNNMHGCIPAETIEKMRGIFDRSDIISARNISPDHKTIYDPSIIANRVSLTEIEKFSLVRFENIKKEKFTGQNLVWTASIMMWKGVIFNEEPLIYKGIEEVLSEIIVAERTMEGLQVDNSYHQHGPMLQFGNYGKSFFSDMTFFLSLFEGTKFAPPAEKIELIRGYFDRGLKWTLYKNQMDVLSCGRQIIKNYPREKYNDIAGTIAAAGTPSARQQLQEADHDLSGSNYFYCSDYLIHRRKNCYFSFKMCSSRVLCSESTNQENRQGNYLGSGVMQYKISGDEYEMMTGLWDFRHLPGLTVVYDNDSLISRGKVNKSSAVGGVGNGENSSLLMNFSSDKLDYNKSVATFGKKVVFNLSDVNNKTVFPVDTTVDSKRYTLPVQVTASGKTRSYTCGTHKISQVSKIICGETAYTFPDGTDLILAIEEKTVPWKNITIWADGSCSGKTVTIWFSGEKPATYIVSPAQESADTLKSLIIPGVCHAVSDKNCGITYLFFFAPGTADVPGIGRVSCDRKAAIMLTREKIYLAEVEQQGGKVCFSIDKKVYNFDAPKGKYAGKSVCLPR